MPQQRIARKLHKIALIPSKISILENFLLFMFIFFVYTEFRRQRNHKHTCGSLARTITTMDSNNNHRIWPEIGEITARKLFNVILKHVPLDLLSREEFQTSTMNMNDTFFLRKEWSNSSKISRKIWLVQLSCFVIPLPLRFTSEFWGVTKLEG